MTHYGLFSTKVFHETALPKIGDCSVIFFIQKLMLRALISGWIY